MRILIFGCGYLGKRVAQAAIDKGHAVFAVTRNPSNAEFLKSSRVEPIVGDVCHVESLNGLPEVEVVLHAVGFDPKAEQTREQVTLGGMKNVVQAIAGRCSHFIQISSTSVYGQSSGEWVDEASECQPNQIGGQLTLAAEDVVRQFGDATSVRTTILRLAGIYGPGRLLARVETLRAGQPLSGRPDSWLNLIHVDDAVTAIQQCLMEGGSSGLYNCVDDCPVERENYYRELARLVDTPPPPKFDESLPAVRGAGGLNKRCSNRRLRVERHWIPKYPSYREGLLHALDLKTIGDH